jgi:hypothetical protein
MQLQTTNDSINNLSLIEPFLDFPDEDSFYFLQVLQRKKDRKVHGGKVVGSNNSSRLIKSYNVTSKEYLYERMDEIIDLCHMFNARAVIGLNRRSFKFCSLEMLVLLSRSIQCNNYNHASLWNRVCGVYYPNKDKRWILDIDNTDMDYVTAMCEEISMIEPYGVKTLGIIPSRSGYHIISRPFNSSKFVEDFGIEIHKNNPTNLYIPELHSINNN